jgi:uncharacterized protein YjeT (DUF2065 family)
MADNKERTLRTVAIGAVASGVTLMGGGPEKFIYGAAITAAGLIIYYFAHKVG